MKKLIGLIIVIISFIPFVVHAESLELSCDKNQTQFVDGGEEIICKINLNSEQDIKNIKANFRTSENLEFDSHNEINKNWTLVSLDGDSFELKHNGSGSKSDSVLELKFIAITARANANLNIQIENIALNNAIIVPNFNQNLKIYSCSNGLNSINVSGLSLTPSFDTDEIYYTTETQNETVMLSAIMQCSQSTIDGLGAKALKYGSNILEISVISPRGIKNIYTLQITRIDSRSKDNNLKKVTVNGEEIGFKSDIMSYSLDVKNDIKTLEISYEKADEKSNVEIIGNENLKVGSNTILIRITSESGDTKTYTLYVNRIANENLFLKKLNIENFNINFIPNKFSYKIESKKILKTLNIIYELTDQNHNVIIIGNEVLKKGDNKIVIRIENEIGETLDYIINLHQEETNYIAITITLAMIATIILLLIIKYKKFNSKSIENLKRNKNKLITETIE